MVGDRIDILTSGGTKFATGFVERVDPIYTVLRTDTGTPVTINNKAWPQPLLLTSEVCRRGVLRQGGSQGSIHGHSANATVYQVFKTGELSVWWVESGS